MCSPGACTLYLADQTLTVTDCLVCVQAARRHWNLGKAALHQVRLPSAASSGSQQSPRGSLLTLRESQQSQDDPLAPGSSSAEAPPQLQAPGSQPSSTLPAAAQSSPHSSEQAAEAQPASGSDTTAPSPHEETAAGDPASMGSPALPAASGGSAGRALDLRLQEAALDVPSLAALAPALAPRSLLARDSPPEGPSSELSHLEALEAMTTSPLRREQLAQARPAPTQDAEQADSLHLGTGSAEAEGPAKADSRSAVADVTSAPDHPLPAARAASSDTVPTQPAQPATSASPAQPAESAEAAEPARRSGAQISRAEDAYIPAQTPPWPQSESAPGAFGFPQDVEAMTTSPMRLQQLAAEREAGNAAEGELQATATSH